jgi:predicted transcriptional regulator
MQSRKDVERLSGPISDDLPDVSADENLTEIIKKMIVSGGPVLVKDNGKLQGVITSGRVLQTVIEGAETS